MHYSNKCRKPGIEYQINDLVYLLTKNLALLKHRAQKPMPKFIGPSKILKTMNNSSNITLELPQEFKDRKINPMFHTNLVSPYIKNNNILFPKRDTKVYYNFGNDEDQEWLVEEILAHKCVEAYAYMHKVNPNIFPHFLSFYLCITILSLFAHHSDFF